MATVHRIVFRETAERVSLGILMKRIDGALARSKGRSDGGLSALIAAGQLESALADLQSPLASDAAALTDQLAELCLRTDFGDFSCVHDSVKRLACDLSVWTAVSDPEGFSYYALHPLDFADAMDRFDPHSPIALIGIRSIGTTLSGVALARLRKRSAIATRITVRPTGHPYERQTSFSAPQKRWLTEQQAAGARFIVVDEGPGLSGSSFLSVAESLVQHGIAPCQVMLLGTRMVDPEQLCSSNAAQRWRCFQFDAASSRIFARFANLTSLSGGNWRTRLLNPTIEWPASWTAMESAKFLSDDFRYIFKFEGLGNFGEHVHDRASAICESGFGPRAEQSGDGISRYEFIPGTPLTRQDLSTELLERIAEYCSFRAVAFRADSPDHGHIRNMVEFNFSQETGRSFEGIHSTVELPVIVDGRMHPHEWIRAGDGRVLKVDGAQHGQDHFLPGPTDIAWDLAGAIIEWNMDEGAALLLVESFRKRTGHDVSRRLPYFQVAYSAFRSGYCKMASEAVPDPREKSRLERSHLFYSAKMDRRSR